MSLLTLRSLPDIDGGPAVYAEQKKAIGVATALRLLDDWQITHDVTDEGRKVSTLRLRLRGEKIDAYRTWDVIYAAFSVFRGYRIEPDDEPNSWNYAV